LAEIQFCQSAEFFQDLGQSTLDLNSLFQESFLQVRFSLCPRLGIETMKENEKEKGDFP
jgi:hypothetical protein